MTELKFHFLNNIQIAGDLLYGYISRVIPHGTAPEDCPETVADTKCDTQSLLIRVHHAHVP